ncbi:Npun_F0494 family protein [Prochlorococcus sp. MIT 1341]|uniref:Npun_F0494 family protein n=1 Tax=Prochlorococcus sp. MIT 1341 TaxID=3096221 RepID=UPI0039BFC4A0
MQNSTLLNKTQFYNPRSVSRAVVTIRSLPFNSIFYTHACERGLNAICVFSQRTLYCQAGSRWYKSSSAVERAFRWMIKIGIMRREVDGQGITSQIRITPLGRFLLERYPSLTAERASTLEFFCNWIRLYWLN